MQEALLQLHVPPDPTQPLKPQRVNPSLADDSADFLPNATPILPMAAPPEKHDGINADGTITLRVETASVSVPDLSGMSKRSAISRCQELGLKLRTSGAGIAIFQLPPAGTMVPEGETCIVTFARGKPTTNPKPTTIPRSPAAPAQPQAQARGKH